MAESSLVWTRQVDGKQEHFVILVSPRLIHQQHEHGTHGQMLLNQLVQLAPGKVEGWLHERTRQLRLEGWRGPTPRDGIWSSERQRQSASPLPGQAADPGPESNGRQ
ncbi:hypothetical protein ACOZ38_28550 [Sphaerisporangium viridialbum]|uniref:hypothetical protein n=1 Tax=Sphaerisporangium viridialbum TaxID=46189 RepID=UPI003C793020